MRKSPLFHLMFLVVAVASWASLTKTEERVTPPPSPVITDEVTMASEPGPASRDDDRLELELPSEGVNLLEHRGDRALVHIDMQGHRRLALEVEFSGPSRGWSLNLGDSNTNNGWGGDSMTAINDAELQILDGNLEVYGSDLLDHDPAYGHKVRFMKRWENVVQVGGVVRLEVADGEVTYIDDDGRRETLRHHGLFALSGQDDIEAGVNYDLFLGINRVVLGGRTGTGVSRVKVSFL